MNSDAAMQRFAAEWVDGWNRRDLQAVLSHYTDDVEFISPRVAAAHARGAPGDPSGRLLGKAALRAYFQEALDKLATLSLTIQDVLPGVAGTFAVVYTRETGAKVAEVFELDDHCKAKRVQVFYDAVC